MVYLVTRGWVLWIGDCCFASYLWNCVSWLGLVGLGRYLRGLRLSCGLHCLPAVGWCCGVFFWVVALVSGICLVRGLVCVFELLLLLIGLRLLFIIV